MMESKEKKCVGRSDLRCDICLAALWSVLCMNAEVFFLLSFHLIMKITVIG